MSGSAFRVIVRELVMTLTGLVAPYETVAVVVSAIAMLLAMLETDDHRLCTCTHSLTRPSHRE